MTSRNLAAHRLKQIKRSGSYAESVLDAYGSKPIGQFYDDIEALTGESLGYLDRITQDVSAFRQAARRVAVQALNSGAEWQLASGSQKEWAAAIQRTEDRIFDLFEPKGE